MKNRLNLLLRTCASFLLMLCGIATIVASGGGGGGGESPTPLTIVAQPASQNVFDGRSASFTISANNASTFQWQRLNGSTWADVAGATSATYTFTAALAQNGMQLRVVVGGSGNTLTSSAVTLTVLEPASITTQPLDLDVPVGLDVNLSVTAAGASPTFRWQGSSDGGGTWADLPNGAGATLALGLATLVDNGRQFRVVVSNAGATVTSRAATLVVFAPVAIVAHPASVGVTSGNAATFSVAATNATGYQWQQLNGGSWVDITGAVNATYSFTAQLAQDGLQLRVTVRGSGSGSGNIAISNPATLTVTPAVVAPAITGGPLDSSVAAGSSATFTVAATGSTLSYRWQVSANSGGSFSDVADGTAATLVLQSPVLADNGKQYRAVVSNSAGSVTSRAATLSVVAPVSITTQPVSPTVTDGATATFTVVASNATAYQWQRLVTGTWADVPGATAASYAFTASLAQSGQQLRVMVSNSVGSVFSNPAQLTVNAIVLPVVITAQPQNASVNEGSDAAFAVTVSGSTPAYRWQLSSNGGAAWTDIPGATGSTYVQPATTEDDDGKQFRVIASNSLGSVTSNVAVLTVVIEFRVVSGGDACGIAGCGTDSGGDGGGGGGDGGGAGAGAGLSAMRNARATAYKPSGQVLGAANVGADYLVSLYPRAYTGPFIVEFADDGSGNGEYFDESKRLWRPLEGQKLRVMVPTLTHHISANPMTEAAYQYAVQQAGSQAALTVTAMQTANALMLAQLNAKLPLGYQPTDVTNFVIPLSSNSGIGALTNTRAGRYGAVMAALPIAGTLHNPELASPALAFARQLAGDIQDDAQFNASSTVPSQAYGSDVAARLSTGLCTAVSIWGSSSLPAQATPQGATTARPGQLTLLAGTMGGDGNCDGWGSNARFHTPKSVATDVEGNVYVADQYNFTIRRISSGGSVQTLAGSPGQQGTADGVGPAARLSNPRAIAVAPDGTIYIGDGNAIRKITPAGAVSTWVGSILQSGTQNGNAATARFGPIVDLALDSDGVLYVADGGATVRKVTSAGDVSTAASTCGSSGLGIVTGVTIDSQKNLYYADANTSYRICKQTVSGAASEFATGANSSDGPFYEPRGLAIDDARNIYLADGFNEVIRKITPAGVVTTLAGSVPLDAENNRRPVRGSSDGFGADVRFRRPNDVAVDGSGNVFVADEENNTIRRISTSGETTTLAGLAPSFGLRNSTGADALFYGLAASVVGADGNVYVVDAYNFVIRKITPAGVVTTLAGTPGVPGFVDSLSGSPRFRFAGTFVDDTRVDRTPVGMAIDSAGNLYVAEPANNAIRKITPQGIVTTVLVSSVGEPNGVTVDGNGNLYFSTFNGIRRLPAGSNVHTAFASGFSSKLSVDRSGNVYAIGSTTVYKITPAGAATLLAGVPGAYGSADGDAATARFAWAVGVAVDASDNVYVAESAGFLIDGGEGVNLRAIRKISQAGGVTVSTVVGRAGSSGNLLGALPASLGRVRSVGIAGPNQIVITADDGVFLATFP